MSKVRHDPSTLRSDMKEERKSRRGVNGLRVKFELPSDVATAGGAAADPHPNFKYHGGPVVLDPQVFAIYLIMTLVLIVRPFGLLGRAQVRRV